MSESPPRTVKVAVVGSGLAGLTATHLLTQPIESINGKEGTRLEVHLFEKADSIGMDSSSISVPLPGTKKEWRIDVPMRSFQGGYYPNLVAMYKTLGVSFRERNYSYSFSFLAPSDKRWNITTTMLYNGASGLAGVSKPTILGGRPRSKDQNVVRYLLDEVYGTGLFIILTIQVAICYVMTLWHSLPFLRPRGISKMMLGEWVKEVAPKGRLAKWTGMDVAWRDYVETIFLPLMSAMCTAPEEDILNHPVEEILDYCWLTLGTHHYVVEHGVRDVVARLSSHLKDVHLSSTIVAIRPDPKDARLVSIDCAGPNGEQTYDGFHHLVLATQASRAIPLLASYANALPVEAKVQREAVEAQMRCLRTFKYRSTIVINHTDSSLLPDEPQDRRDLNLITSDWEDDGVQDDHLCVPSTYTMATQIIPRPNEYPTFLPAVYQTTNPFIPPRKDTILNVSSLERAVLTCEAKEALEGLCRRGARRWWECPTESKCGLGHLQGAGRLDNSEVPGLWICGSYAYLGVPLLEGCVVSARNIVEEGILKNEGMKLSRVPWDA